MPPIWKRTPSKMELDIHTSEDPMRALEKDPSRRATKGKRTQRSSEVEPVGNGSRKGLCIYIDLAGVPVGV